MEIQDLMQVLVLAAVVLAFYWQHRSFPPDKTSELIDRLASLSEQTTTKLDDLLVEIAITLNEMRGDPDGEIKDPTTE